MCFTSAADNERHGQPLQAPPQHAGPDGPASMGTPYGARGLRPPGPHKGGSPCAPSGLRCGGERGRGVADRGDRLPRTRDPAARTARRPPPRRPLRRPGRRRGADRTTPEGAPAQPRAAGNPPPVPSAAPVRWALEPARPGHAEHAEHAERGARDGHGGDHRRPARPPARSCARHAPACRTQPRTPRPRGDSRQSPARGWSGATWTRRQYSPRAATRARPPAHQSADSAEAA